MLTYILARFIFHLPRLILGRGEDIKLNTQDMLSNTMSVKNTSFINHLRTMYKCAHLHSHFSGYVSAGGVLRMISDDKWGFNGREIIFGESTPDAANKVRAAINTAWNSSFEKSASLIGGLFFNCIKNPKMYGKYLEFIEQMMDVECITHLELRLRVGSVDGWTMRDEIKVLNDFCGELILRQKSLTIIPQFSKHSTAEKAIEYFTEINTAVSDLGATVIKSFDLTGNENSGKQLYDFDLEKISKMMGPPCLHCGEYDTPIAAKNIGAVKNLITKLPADSIKRIGHGLNSPAWRTLPRDTIYEYCPLTYMASGIKIDIKLLNNARPIITVNADDCNKLRDRNLNDNFIKLWTDGVAYFKLLCSLLYSVIGSYAVDSIKTIMLQKWHEQYCKYYYYEENGRQYYAIDRDCKWFVNTEDVKLLPKLELRTKKFMEKAYLMLDGTPNEKCAKLVAGMELYAYKPNLSRDVTWTTEEYNLPEFQYTYIRLKSLQRYTECYTMYEYVFNSVDADELSGIKSVLSIGGGCGFEIIALADYFEKRELTAPISRIVDVANAWVAYKDLIGVVEYIVADVNVDDIGSTLAQSDLFIFSYVFKYLKDPFFELINKKFSNKPLIFNERRMKINLKVPSTQLTDDIYVRGINRLDRPIKRTFESE